MSPLRSPVLVACACFRTIGNTATRNERDETELAPEKETVGLASSGLPASVWGRFNSAASLPVPILFLVFNLVD